MLTNTLKAHRRLTRAGVDERQAEAFIEVMEEAGGRVATKEDMDQRFDVVDQLLANLQQFVKAENSTLSAKISDASGTTAKRVFAAVATGVGLIIAFISVMAAIGVL